MTGTDEWKELPEVVWYARRIPPENEPNTYYDKKYNRLYRALNGVKQFMNANSTSKFEVFQGTVAWEQIEL